MGAMLGLLSLSAGCGELPVVEETDTDAGLGETTPKVVHGDRDTSAAFPSSAHITIPLHNSACTGTIISEHYLLTAAHCVSGIEGDDVTIDVTAPGGARTLYQRAPAQFFVHPDVASGNSDLAVVYTRGAVHEQTIDRRASFYADARSPFDEAESDTVFFAGYGYGTEVGGSSSCSGAPLGVLRWSAAELLSETSRSVKALGYNDSKGCQGDSGMALFLQRPALGRSRAMLIYGVYSGTPVETRELFGFKTQPALTFVYDSIRASNVFPIRSVRDHRGYRAVAYREDPIGPRPVVGLAGKCMTAVGSGMPVELRTCDGSAGQQFTMQPNGMMQSLGLCIDLLNAVGGGSVYTRACDPALGSRLVSLTRAGQITGPSTPSTGSCIGPRDGATADGTPLVLTPCNNGSAQAWRWWNLVKPPRVPPFPGEGTVFESVIAEPALSSPTP